MRNKIIGLLGLALVGLFLNGCVSSRILTSVDNVSPGKAMVIGKFQVSYNGTDMTKDAVIAFNSGAYRLDENGYLFLEFPVGQNAIRAVAKKGGVIKHNYGAEDLTFQLTEGGAAYYIGDITVNWHGMGNGAAWGSLIGGELVGGIVGGALIQDQATKGAIVITVETNTAAAQAAFQKKFSTDRSLTPSLLVVKPRQ